MSPAAIAPTSASALPPKASATAWSGAMMPPVPCPTAPVCAIASISPGSAVFTPAKVPSTARRRSSDDANRATAPYREVRVSAITRSSSGETRV